MKKYLLLIAALAITVLAGGDDVGNVIKATPLNDTYTSDGVCLFAFNTARARTPDDIRDFGSSSVGTQWFDDGTTNALYRAKITDWLYICNYSTSMSLIITINAGYQPTGTNNETTPTISTSEHMFTLNSYGSSPYYAFLDVGEDEPIFYGGVRNIGILPSSVDTDYASSATFRSDWLSSATVHIIGR